MNVEYAEFEAIFKPLIRVYWNPAMLVGSVVAKTEITDIEEVRGWHLSWYTKDGRRASYDQVGAWPVTVAGGARGLGGADREAQISETREEALGGHFAVATYDWGGPVLVLDGCHKLVNAYRSGLEHVSITRYALRGPMDPMVVADCDVWSRAG